MLIFLVQQRRAVDGGAEHREESGWRSNGINISPGLIFSGFLAITKLTHYELQRHR